MTSHRTPDHHPSTVLGRVLGSRRAALVTDVGQTAIVAVLAVTLIVGIIGAALVANVVQSAPLQAQTQVTVLARRALEAGENAYVTAINTNPSLAQCSTDTNDSATCSGLDYGEWNPVPQSGTDNGDAEYYAFGNPQPTFDPTTHALSNLAVQVVGAARSTSTTNNYLFDTETINLASTNGFLTHVWWSNFESYNQTGDYSGCSYNWQNDTYDANNDPGGCEPVSFASGDYLFGPTYTNDSIFVSNSGGSPTFGNGSVSPKVPSTVETADPRCLFVDSSDGMNGNGGAGQNYDGDCANATGDVGLYDSTNSSYGHAVETPPQSDGQLATIAGEYGCLYSGPTQITINGANMTVTSPDTTVTTVSDNGTPVPWDNNNVSTNYTDCPNNGTAPLPADGVVYVEDASGSGGSPTQPAQPITSGANPFDDYVANTATNVTASPSPTPVSNGKAITLTATVTSSVSQIGTGATVAFSQTESGFGTSSHAITNCGSQANWSAPVAVGSNYQSTVTCSFNEISSDTGVFSAVYSGGTYTNTSQGTLGQTNTLTAGVTPGPDSQTTAGGCSSCYYGESSDPDAEGDAFVNGALSGDLTIGTSNNVVIDGNLTYADCKVWTKGQSGLYDFCPYNNAGTNDSLGLIANNYVEVNHPINSSTGAVLPSCTTPGPLCDPSTSGGAQINDAQTQGITIDAAILALTQSFVVNNYKTTGPEGQLAIYGSVQQFARGPVGTFNTYGLVSGYVKNYTWDPLLDYVSPPDYLVPSTAPWDLTSITANAGEHPSNVCPPLQSPYGGANTPITTYCSQATGGLPGYPAATVPSPPTNVTATSSAGGVATVTWSAPSNTGNSPILHYNVQPTPTCASCTGLGPIAAGSTSTNIGGLNPGTSYTFTVTATNSSGTSDPSAPSPLITAPLVPYPPTAVSATGNSNDTVTVIWTDPSNNGSPISQYTVTPSPPCGSCTGLQQYSPTATSTIISGLTVGATYTFTVTATNGIGTSVPSATTNPVEVPTVPGAPLSVTATSFANGQSVVSWNPPASNGGLTITGYKVTSSPGSKTCTTTGTTTCTVTGLTNGSPYTFTVTATNPIGTGVASAPSAAATPAAVPGIPTIGTATAGNAQASVTFSTPATNGTPITGYTVTSSPGGITATCASSPCVVTGLTNGTSYKFSVVANSAAGSSASSGLTSSVTPIGPPSAPLSVTATSYANSQSVVSWSVPATNGGSAITGYTVTSSGGQTCSTTGATNCTVTGLTNGTAYTFTVTATNALGTGVASAPSAAATPASVPGAPTGVGAVAGYTQATVTWNAPASSGGAPITGYTVTSNPGGKTCSTTATSCVVTGLTDGTAYTFTVIATNAAGNSSASVASNSVTPSTTVPGAPTGVTASSFANTQSAVSWTAPTYTGGSAITKYTVTSSAGQTCTTPNGTTTSCTVTGLTNGTPYTFTVTATNGVGTGPASSPSGWATPSTVPGAPTGVSAATHQNASSAVTWSPPASNGGNPITAYKVTSSPGAFTCTTTGATSCSVAGLTNGQSYTFTVTATNGSGTGAPSTASTAVVPANVPGAPTGVSATSNASTQSTVSWTAPSSNGGLAITGYTVTSNAGQVCTTTGATSCTVTGLSNGVAYTFTVTATNAVGTGPASAASAPAIPAGPPTPPTAVSATSGQNGSSTVSWAAPSDSGGSPVTSYTVTSSTGGHTCTTTGALTCTVTGLTNGQSYTFTVTATNSAGTSAPSTPSNAVVPASTPGAPTGVTATNIAGTKYGVSPEALVTWVAPSNSGGSPITSYTVTSTGGPTPLSCPTANGTTTTCIFEGLTAGTTYTFTVVAINAIGTGPASAPASATVSTVPDAPSAVTATPVPNVPYLSAPQMTVSWTAPNNGGAPITGYTVTSSGGGTCSAVTPSCTITSGLTAGTAYTFTVTAMNASGTGLSSSASPPVVAATVAQSPTIGSASYTTGIAYGQPPQVKVNWTDPANNGGSAITGYTVTSSPAGGTCSGSGVTATTCTVSSGLTAGTPYTFSVQAINGVGSSAPSGPTASITPATVPAAPTGVTAANVSGTPYGNAPQATVSWTASATGGAAVTGYTVTASPGSGTCSTASTTCNISGLTAGTTYTFTVTATNAAGTGQPSGTATLVAATVPQAPTISSASYVTGIAYGQPAQVVVTWTDPANNGGAAITGYSITSSPAGGTCTATGATATTCTVSTGLTAGSAYTFSVKATNSVGSSIASGSSASVTPATVSQAPTIGTVSNVTGIAYGQSPHATVTWTDPANNGGAAITGYTVTASPGGATCAASGATANSCTFTSGLTAGTAYTFTVTATNAAGVSQPSSSSASLTPATVPQAPTVGTATNVAGIGYSNPPEVTVSWTAANNGGAAVSGYTVTSSPAGGTCTASGTSCTILTGLTAGTSYSFSVVATSAAGTSQSSGSSNSVTAATVPQAPTIGTASYQTGITFGNPPHVTVTWTDPANNGGSALTGYTVTSSPAGGTCTGSTGTATSCTITSGLTAGTAYTFTVTATNSAGTSGPSGATSSITPATLPSVPTGVTASNVTGIANGNNPQVTVSWTASSNGGSAITGYTVTANSGGGTCSTSGTTCTISTNLTAGTSYTYTVTASNAAGTTTPSTASAAVTEATVPGTPTIGSASYVTAVPNGNSPQVAVTWTDPASNGGSAITGYTVTANTGGGTCTVAGATATTCTVSSNLTAGSSYSFSVVATNVAGNSVASALSNSVTPATVPSAPTIGTATAVTGLPNGSAPEATVTWTDPSSSGGSAITGYTVTSSPAGGTCSASGATATSCTVSSGLTAGTPYTFTVTATNAAGTSLASGATSSVTPATEPAAPSAVLAANVSGINYLSAPQIAVSWTAGSNGGAVVSNYTVTASPGGATCSSATTSCSVTTGLTAGTAYTFTVTATNAAGTSPSSTPSSSATAATVAQAPTIGTATAVAGIPNGNSPQVAVTWTDPANTGGSAITGYTVTANTGGGTCTVAGATATTCTVSSNLTAGSSYTFSVKANNGAGSSAASGNSTSVTPATVAGAPTIGTTTVVAGVLYGNAPQAVVHWTDPASNGGSAITGYTVTANTGGGTCTVTGATATTCTVSSNLTAGSSYSFSVVATNAAGNSVASALSNTVTPATVSAPPTGVSGTSNANASSVVSWTAPPSNGGSTITGYTVTSSPGSFVCTTTGATSCTVSGLANGTPYTFTVTATNGEGTSSPSSASAAATPATTPGAPTAVTATSNGNQQSVVSWTAPVSNGGTAITDYTVTSSPGGFVCNISTTSCTVAGLTNGTSYTFTVTATNAAGTGPASSASAAAIPATVPGAPTIGTATNVAGIAFSNSPNTTVTWTDPGSNGGTAITGYTVTSNPAGGTCNASGATATSCTVTSGLTAGTAYTYSVTATNAAGTGSASGNSGSVTAATVPGAPTAVAGTSYANASSVVSWTAPGSGGTPITGYTVTSSPGGLICTTTGATSCTVSGLTNGTGYTFTVTATNAAGTGSSSAASATATPAAVPGSPTAVTASPTSTTTSVAVNWTAPASNGAAISNYTVTSSPGAKTCTSTTPGCTVPGLTAGTTYSFTVTATNAAGTGSPSSASNSIIAGAPGASTIGTATNSAGTAYGNPPQVVVTWTDPSSNGGSAITGYTVTSSPAGGTCTTAVATATSCTVTTGLTAGNAYTFSVTAANANGTGPASGATSSVTASTLPQAPTIGTATNATGVAYNSAPQVTVNWTDGNNGGSAITGYTVASVPAGGSCTTSVSTATSCLITTGLTAGTAYTFSVTATNVNGTGSSSAQSPSLTPATLPAAPTGVTGAAGTATTQLVVSWTAPANGGSAVTGYTVTSSPGSFTCTTTGATSCTVSGLTNKTAYTFTVTATNAEGTGLASSASTAVTAGVPGIPTAATAVGTTTSTSVAVNWTAPANTGGSAITGYTATANPGGKTCTTTGATTCTVTGLTAKSSYTFTVTASNTNGTGPASAPTNAVIAGTPPSPTGVTAVATSSATSATITWVDPSGVTGAATSGYTVTSNPSVTTPAACSTSLTGTSTTCVFTGLTTGTSYTFTVSAINTNGTGVPSAPSSAIVVGTPGAPTGQSASTQTTTTVKVSWTAPASNGGSAVTSYTATASPGGATCTATAPTTNCTVSGLSSATTYTFTVTATNGTGTGPPSGATTGVSG